MAWDLDNTLFDRDGATRRFCRWYLASFAPAVSEKGAPARLDAIMTLDNGGDGDRLAFCRETLALVGGRPELADQLWNSIRTRLPEFIQPDEAVVACLDRLRDKYQLALISNGGSALQRAKMERAGISRYFHPDHVFISGEVGFEKPGPQIFETMLRVMGKLPGQVLYVGDHPVNDIAGATAVGMPTCWVSRGRLTPPGLRADATVKTAGEVASWLRSVTEGGSLAER